ncbi:SapC [Bosea sp. LC85]|uniref:SapC family protein n=1 Tax=Bosea sp. LC85 TaxID=1502851 RepID=UPI0004E4703A|nr:SapC family protein [Bosea sp. LC85]KFC64611.1 SapC [Bosea sp. LC85]
MTYIPLDREDRTLKVGEFGTSKFKVNPVIVPVAPIETPTLAPLYPIIWRSTSSGVELVAMTGLRPDHRYLARRKPSELPLLIAAHPFSVQDDGVSEKLTILFDTDVVNEDSAEAVIDDNGSLSANAERRCEALWAFVQSRRKAAPAFAALAEAGVLLPWEPAFDTKRGSFSITGLLILDEAFFGSALHRELIAKHGWHTANVFVLHRISKHRITTLTADFSSHR